MPTPLRIWLRCSPIDEVGTDYLDLLLHLTGDDHMGRSTIGGGA